MVKNIGKVVTVLIIIVMIATISMTRFSMSVQISDDMTFTQHDNTMNSQIASESIMTWHDSCTNLATFLGRGDNTWPHDTVVEVVFGSINCNDGYFYSNDVGSGKGHHGPLYYHALTSPFNISKFVELRAVVEINGSSASLTGWIRIGLHAANNASIITLQVVDPWISAQSAYANLIYKYENGTLTETPNSYPEYATTEPYYETFGIIHNASGLCTSFPRMPNQILLEEDQLEVAREIEYISIQFGGYSTWPLCENMRIHDLMLMYYWTDPAQTTTTTETTTTSTTTTSSTTSIVTTQTTPSTSDNVQTEYPDLLLIISIGAGGTLIILVIVIILFSRRNGNALT